MFHMTLLTPVVTHIPQWTMADRLRKSREDTGLDQTEFSERSGISRAAIGNYEQGKRAPRGLYLRAWAEATGVPIEWLETGKAPVMDDEGDESRLSDLNRRPVLYKDAPCPDFVPSWMVDEAVTR